MKMLKALVAVALVLPSMSPMTALAINKNAVEENEKENGEKSAQAVEEHNGAAKQQQDSYGVNIEGEAYATFADMKANFVAMQSQYGDLTETNMSTGYKTYLSQIQADNENMALTYKLIAQKSGSYSVSENGLVLSQDKANALVDSMFATSQSKQDALNAEDKENTQNETETDLNTESSNITGDIEITGNAFGSQYQQSVQNNQQQANDYQNEVQDNMNNSQKEQQSLLNSALKDVQKTEDSSQKTNKAIVNSYDSLKSQITASQKTVKSNAKEAANKKFTSVCAGFNAAKKAATK